MGGSANLIQRCQPERGLGFHEFRRPGRLGAPLRAELADRSKLRRRNIHRSPLLIAWPRFDGPTICTAAIAEQAEHAEHVAARGAEQATPHSDCSQARLHGPRADDVASQLEEPLRSRSRAARRSARKRQSPPAGTDAAHVPRGTALSVGVCSRQGFGPRWWTSCGVGSLRSGYRTSLIVTARVLAAR